MASQTGTLTAQWIKEGRQRCIEIGAIHEFGHALSFAHEHLRPEIENITDSGCRIDPNQPGGTNGDVTVGL
ncbi:MAG: hypothetical protein KAH20_10955 [Methylococcales bacterium]|nr:hypothetical protein [Methylococcales bacterium]